MNNRIIALQVANDILSGYGEYAQKKFEEYTADVIALAEIFMEWAEHGVGVDFSLN